MMIGRTLGHYRLVEQIGMGGMATVYKAYDPDADRYVAIKVLPEHFSKDPTFRQRFEREAKAIAKLEHLHILPLFAYGEEDGIAYMVMRYLKAGSLTERIQAGALTLPEASRLLTQIAGALDHAHANGVLHRDVKPSNVLLDTDGNAYLTDFGIAKMTESALDLTGAGILGTPAYMSPEQCRGSAELTPASDQYALGIILYEMVTGRAPYQAETPIALIHKQLFDPLPMPRQLRPDLPEEAEQVILKALTKDPQLRYPTCSAMAAAFARSVAQLAAPLVDKDGTMVSTKPSAVTTPAIAAEAAVKSTAPVIDEATALHPLPAPAPEAVAPRPQRRIPVWALVLGAVLALGLVVALLVSLRKWRDNTAAESEATATPEYIAAQPTVEQPAAAAPPPAAPAESAVEETPPNLSATPRRVKPCDWDNHGVSLCIFLPGQEQPFKIMENFTNFSRPSWSPDGQRIAVSAKGPGDQDNDIYLVNSDGSDLKHLSGMGNDNDPAWSPDGEWLAFHSNCDLAIMHPDGSAPTVLWSSDGSKCAFQPQWSPDGRLLVVGLSPVQGEFPMAIEVWVVAVKGGDVTPITKTTYKNWDCASDWAFSPDSAQVAYKDGDCKAWLAKADGSGQPEALPEFPYDWQGNTYPQWAGQAQAASPAAEVYYDGFDGAVLDPAHWQPNSAISVKGGRVLFSSKAADRAGVWDGSLEAVLPAPVKRIETMIGLEWARGERLGFGLDFWDDESAQPKSVWFNAAGSVLLDEGQGEFHEIMPPKSTPVEYHLLVEWLDTGEAAVRIGDQKIARLPVHDFAHRVVFWGHLETGDEMSGYLEEVRLTYAAPEETFTAAPPAAEKAPVKPTPAPGTSKGPPGKLLFNCPDTQPPQLCIWDSATDQVTPLTRDLQFETIFGAAWSPDGQQIVFDGGSAPEKQHPDHKLYLLNEDDSGLKQLTPDGDTNDQEPDWSPDGEWIAFHRNCSLWVVRSNGAEAKMLLEQTDKLCVGGGGGNIQWSPDSQRIAFTNISDKADQGELWLINRDGSKAHIARTFDRKEWPWAVGWSPDGRQIDLWYTPEKHALVNADGSGEPEVLGKPVIDKLHLWTWFARFWPRWAK